MISFHLSPSARQDVLDIYDYIAADNLDAADRFVDEHYQAFDHLATFPHTGHSRPDLAGTRPLLFWPVGAYLIIYRADRQPLEIIAIAHAARDIPAFLRYR